MDNITSGIIQDHAITCYINRSNKSMSELEELQDKMHRIKTWIDAYPLKIFPEPDFKKAHKVLQENGMTLDAISASNMRHVLNGIRDIIENSTCT